MVRLVTPDELPQGPILSYAALQARFSGHRKAAGPMMVPSSPSPCAARAVMATDSAATQDVKRIVASCLRDGDDNVDNTTRAGGVTGCQGRYCQIIRTGHGYQRWSEPKAQEHKNPKSSVVWSPRHNMYL